MTTYESIQQSADTHGREPSSKTAARMRVEAAVNSDVRTTKGKGFPVRRSEYTRGHREPLTGHDDWIVPFVR
jgi:hypothetical protein